MVSRVFLGSVFFACVLLTQPVLAQEADAPPTGGDAEARGLFMAAQVAFDEGRFESAVQYFLQAFRLSGRPELLYNIGNTYDRLQQPEEALRHFEQYLQQRPGAENERQVEARVRLLRQTLETRQAPSPSEATPAPATVSAPTPEQTAQASAITAPEPTPSAPPAATAADEGSSASWMIWGGLGAVVVAAAVVAVVLASGGDTTQEPLVPREGTPVVKL